MYCIKMATNKLEIGPAKYINILFIFLFFIVLSISNEAPNILTLKFFNFILNIFPTIICAISCINIDIKKQDILSTIKYSKENNDKLVLNFTSCYLDYGFPPTYAGTSARLINH